MLKSRKAKIKSAFVLGSTSETAKAICIELANKNRCKRFHLVARNLKANRELKEKLENLYGAYVTEEKVDLSSDSSIENSNLPQVDFFDLYLITAGALGNAHLARSDIHEALKITSVNFAGIIPWITSITSESRLSKPGRLWLFSSVAADRGRPSNYHYGAAKAGITTFCEGLLLRCVNKPFSIRIIKAGFIATPMSEGKAPKFLCVKPSSLARDLLQRPNHRGIEYLPSWWRIIMFLVKLLPNFVASKL